jgi:outer membrane protein X
MKRIILAVLITFVGFNGYSQKKDGFRVGLDLGVVPTNGGLRMGIAAIVRDVESSNGEIDNAKLSASSSFVGTYDYYFNKSGKSFVPYVGGGAGYYAIGNVEFNEADVDAGTELQPEVSGVFGGLVRAGFEWGKFRMGLEYNLVPDTNLEDSNGANKGSVANSYLGIHLGFYLGGGKWGK